MWSSPYTSANGTVKDSYQRIGIRINCTAICDNKYEHLITCGLRFIILEIHGNESEEIISEIPKNMAKLYKMTTEEQKLVIAVEIHKNNYDEEEVEDLLMFIDPDIVFVVYQGTSQATVSLLDLVQSILIKSKNTRCHVGFSSAPTSEIQWIIENARHDVKLVSLVQSRPPNLQLRTVEFLHSKSIDCLVNLRLGANSSSSSSSNGGVTGGDNGTGSASASDHHLHHLDAMARRYGRSTTTVLTKALLQLGVMIAFSEADESSESSELVENLLPLCHPFTTRAEHMAPSIVKRFYVSVEDLAELETLSELEEADADSEWADLASTAPLPIELSDELPR